MTMHPTSVLYQINSDNLGKLIEEVKSTVIEEMSKKKVVEKPLTREEAAAFLRIQPATLDRRIKSNVLPTSLRHFNGGTLYFFASELEAFLKKPK